MLSAYQKQIFYAFSSRVKLFLYFIMHLHSGMSDTGLKFEYILSIIQIMGNKFLTVYKT